MAIVIKDKRWNEYMHRTYFKGIRNNVLQKLLLIWFHLTFSEDSPLRKELEKRCVEKGLFVNFINMVYCLKPEDIQKILSCSRRTAYDYINTLRNLV